MGKKKKKRNKNHKVEIEKKGLKSCPHCRKKIDLILETCPFCEEMIFQDTIEVSQVSEELLEETLDDIIAEENIVTRSVVKGIVTCIDGIKSLGKQVGSRMPSVGNKLRKSFAEKTKRIFTLHVPNLWKAFVRKTKLDKMAKFFTYEKVLGVAIVISTICLITLSVREVLYLDRESEVAQVDVQSTVSNVKKLYDEEAEMGMDVNDGTVVYTYKNQSIADIEDCIIYYKVNPNTNKIVSVNINFKSNLFNIQKMRNYLQVNYGKPKDKRLKEIWYYTGDEISYTYTNGARNYDMEQASIKYIKNAPTQEDLENYRKGILKDKTKKS